MTRGVSSSPAGLGTWGWTWGAPAPCVPVPGNGASAGGADADVVDDGDGVQPGPLHVWAALVIAVALVAPAASLASLVALSWADHAEQPPPLQARTK